MAVSDFIDAIKVDVKGAGNTNVDDRLRRAMVKALKRLSYVRAPFTEGTFTFQTTADQESYDTATSGFANDIAEIDLVEIKTSDTWWVEVEPGTIAHVRDLLRGNAWTAQYPYRYTWYQNDMIFGPAPQTVTDVRVHYHKDATRDASSGTKIDHTASSDAFDNPWFDEGEDLLWNLALKIYHQGYAVDAERAAYYASEYQDAREALHKLWIRRAGRGFQVDHYF